jgi:hypothetical protein
MNENITMMPSEMILGTLGEQMKRKGKGLNLIQKCMHVWKYLDETWMLISSGECLPSKHKPLSSNLSKTKMETKEERKKIDSFLFIIIV